MRLGMAAFGHVTLECVFGHLRDRTGFGEAPVRPQSCGGYGRGWCWCDGATVQELVFSLSERAN